MVLGDVRLTLPKRNKSTPAEFIATIRVDGGVRSPYFSGAGVAGESKNEGQVGVARLLRTVDLRHIA